MATEYHLSSWHSENPISSPRAARAGQPVGSREQHAVWLPQLHTQGARESPPQRRVWRHDSLKVLGAEASV